MRICSFVAVAVAVAMAGLGAAHGAGMQPEQLHVAFRGKVGAYDMVVSWMTMDDTSISRVRYGTVSGVLTSNATGASRSYYKTFNHDVVLEGLAAATRYYYSVGSDQGGWSPEASFMTPPAHPSNAAEANAVAPWRIAVYGDMGVTNSENTTALLRKRLDGIDFVTHVGDFGYADDRLDTKDFESIWNSWQNEVQPIASTKGYMVCPGNHEASCHSFGDWFCPKQLDNFTAYNYRFRMPALESGSGTNMWHSFDYGNAHIIMIDTETDLPHAPEGPKTIFKAGNFGNQLAWLQADLNKAVAQRAQRPWIFVMGHRPLYSSVKVGLEKIIWPNVTQALQAAIEDMLHAAKVDLYIGAHVHGYERTLPVLHNKTTSAGYDNPPSLAALTVGMAGNMEGHQGQTHWLPWRPLWLANRDGEHFGHCELSVTNATHASWEFFSADTGAVLDSFTLVREHAHGY